MEPAYGLWGSPKDASLPKQHVHLRILLDSFRRLTYIPNHLMLIVP